MSALSHIVTFPEALGTGIVIAFDKPAAQGFQAMTTSLIEGYERELSRFRDDSTVSAMAHARHGGSFEFSSGLAPLFDIYDALYRSTSGAIDPLIGADLVRLGYGPDLSFEMQADAFERNGAVNGRACWPDAVERDGATLRTHRAVQLDFGAVGKGFLVDMISQRIDSLDDAASESTASRTPGPTLGSTSKSESEYVIDAGGDLRIHTSQPQSIALEDPSDTSKAIGTASLCDASLCASAPSRRHWFVKDPRPSQIQETAQDGRQPQGHGGMAHESQLILMHHLLNAIDGTPVRDIAASWVCLATASARLHGIDHPTAWADGISTALFVTDPGILASNLSQNVTFDCAVLDSHRQAGMSAHFPGRFFTHE